MKRLLGSALALILVTLFSACSDENGPTAADSASIDLAGAWTGTITYFQDLSPGPPACPPEPISTVLSQSGARVTARIMTLCYGTLELSGTVDGTFLTGALASGSQSVGRVTGLVSSSRIELTTNRGRADEPMAVNRINLVR